MEKKKGKNILILILAIILTLVLTVLTVLLATGILVINIENKSDNSIGDNNNVEILNNISIFFENECSNGCQREINTINGKKTIYISNYEVKIDDKVVYSTDKKSVDVSGLYQLNVYNDIIVTYVHESLGGYLNIYNIDGTEIKKIDMFKNESGKQFYVYPGYSDNEVFNISNDGIISFIGTKHRQGVANTYLSDDGTEIDLCLDGASYDENEIVSGIFEMNYNGNYQFSNIEYISTKTKIKDIKSCY